MKLFDRVVRVIAYRQPDPNDLREKLDNGIEIEKLDMRFEVTKSISREPNTATITIVNAAAAVRAELQTKPLTVRIAAGHDGAPRGLFFGSLMHGESRYEATEWETTLELADGGRAFTRGRLSRSYRSGTSTRAVLRDLAASMGLDLPRALDAAAELEAQIPAGLVVAGPAPDSLSDLLRPLGWSWSIQGGQLQILPDGAPAEGTAWEINQSTGMVGSPEYSAPSKGKKRTLTVRTLLFPELTPGGKILVSSRSVSGLHRISSVRHIGDTAGDDWHTEIEATPL